MKIFVCLDEKGGMLFNKRRQSSDRVVREDMLQILGEKKLYVNSYTAKQFLEEEKERLIVDEECLSLAGSEDYVFVENLTISSFLSEVQELIVYRWKRNYPADFFFDVNLTTEEWELTVSEEMVGNSHECIGKEIYRKKEML